MANSKLMSATAPDTVHRALYRQRAICCRWCCNAGLHQPALLPHVPTGLCPHLQRPPVPVPHATGKSFMVGSWPGWLTQKDMLPASCLVDVCHLCGGTPADLALCAWGDSDVPGQRSLAIDAKCYTSAHKTVAGALRVLVMCWVFGPTPSLLVLLCRTSRPWRRPGSKCGSSCCSGERTCRRTSYMW